MAEGAYEKLEGTKAKKLLERLNNVWPGSAFEADRTVIHARSLMFAKGWILAEVEDAKTMPEKKCTVLDNGHECVPMQFTPDFIPAFMAAHKLALNEEQAREYLYFWFEYVRTGTDRFTLVESLDDMPWREEATPQARKTLSKKLIPLTLEGAGASGFTFRACILFRDTLLFATVHVTPEGQVKLDRGEIIVENLTVIDTLTGF